MSRPQPDLAAPVPAPQDSAPARAVRVGAVPVPRVRPLAEVLAELPGPPLPAPAVPAPAPDRAPEITQDALDRLTHALRPVAARLLSAVVEILDARRPVTHLAAVADPAVLVVLASARARPRRAEGRLRGLRVCPVAPHAVEVAAVVVRGDRAQAVAGRLERAPEGAWRIASLVLV